MFVSFRCQGQLGVGPRGGRFSTKAEQHLRTGIFAPSADALPFRVGSPFAARWALLLSHFKEKRAAGMGAGWGGREPGVGCVRLQCHTAAGRRGDAAQGERRSSRGKPPRAVSFPAAAHAALPLPCCHPPAAAAPRGCAERGRSQPAALPGAGRGD